jgi:tRNA (cytidine/uridine-2'-O-)-methyltransferase
MLRIVLYQPEIAPNTGNIIRLSTNCGADLHLIAPLGFELDDRRLRRAGLDYAEWSRISVHDSFEAFVESQQPARVCAFTTKAPTSFADVRYAAGDCLLFGPETRGLPQELLCAAELQVRIPMRPDSRSLNLSNAVAVACYEVWRQQQFAGAR